MRSSSYIAITGVALALGYYEGSMLGSLPGFFIFFRPVLPFLILCFLLKRPQAAYLTAGVSGAVVDLITSTPSGFIMARWLLIAFLIDIVQEHVITNRSLYGAWLLVVLARTFEGLLLMITFVTSKYILGRLFIAEPVGVQILIAFTDLMVISILFLATSLLTKRFLTFIPFEKGRYGS
jgi:cell shape-determining protein MreD